MTLYETLKQYTEHIAQTLSLPLNWEDAVFTPSYTAHLRGKIVFTKRQRVTLGQKGIIRTNGSLELRVIVPVGAENTANTLIERVLAVSVPGTTRDCTKGTVTLTTPSITSPISEKTRVSATITIPFWAMSVQSQE